MTTLDGKPYQSKRALAMLRLADRAERQGRDRQARIRRANAKQLEKEHRAAPLGRGQSDPVLARAMFGGPR